MSRPSRPDRPRRRDHSRRPISVESLEGRGLMAVYTWTNPVNGIYSVASNWTVNGRDRRQPPRRGRRRDDAVGELYDHLVEHGDGQQRKGGASLSVTGGTFTVTDATNGASSSIPNLTLASNATFASAGGTTSINGGTIGGKLVAAGRSTSAGSRSGQPPRWPARGPTTSPRT